MREYRVEIEEILLLPIIDGTIKKGIVSCNEISKNFNLPYTSLNAILDKIEQMGLVSEPQGYKPRKYLITEEEWKKQRTIYEEKFKVNEKLTEIYVKKYRKNNEMFRELEEEEDNLLPEVIDFFMTRDKVSTMDIATQFKTGINRAERILEQIQARNIISEPDYATNRKLLISKQEWEKNRIGRGNL